jgi:hypothetical protein
MLSQDFKEFIASLNDNRVRYLVVGGYAVALHGYPRYTKGLDFWLDRTPENAARIIKALEDFGFGSLGLQETDFLEEDQIIQLGFPPNRIDLLTSVTGVDFEVCHSSKIEVIVEGVEVSFIDLENLRRNKKASGRFQDLADLENLQ